MSKIRLQRQGADGLPRNEFMEMDEDLYLAVVTRTNGGFRYLPVVEKKKKSRIKPIVISIDEFVSHVTNEREFDYTTNSTHIDPDEVELIT